MLELTEREEAQVQIANKVAEIFIDKVLKKLHKSVVILEDFVDFPKI